MHNKKLGTADAKKKKIRDNGFDVWDWIMGSFSVKGKFKNTCDYAPTSVCTIDIRYDRISDTNPRMSTNSWSRICCKSLSRAMNVPVRPTPALKKRFRHTSLSASTLLETNWRWKKTKTKTKNQKHTKTTCSIIEKKRWNWQYFPLNWCLSMHLWLMCLLMPQFDHCDLS